MVGLRRAEIVGSEEMDHLVGEPRGRIDGSQPVQAAGPEARFLFRFPQGASLRRLTGIELAGRDLVEESAGRVPVLADEEDLVLAHEGHDCGRPGMANHLQVSRVPVGEGHLLYEEMDHLPAIDLTHRSHQGAEDTRGPLRPQAGWLFLALGILAGCMSAGPARAAFPAGFVEETMAEGLDQPVGMAFLPDGRLLVVEQNTGRVRMIQDGGVARVDPVLTVGDLNLSFVEQGLLGIAVDPGWPSRPYLYLHYDHGPTEKIRISRFEVAGDLADPTGDSLVADPASRYDLLTDIPDAAGNHNGGTLRFGSDGMLYVSLGEDAVPCAAQDTSSLRGVILRLDVSRLPGGPGGPPAKSLLTPPDNPFSGPNDNARLTWALGLRNPFRFHVDPADGRLLIADVGQSLVEEVDWVTTGGLNFGWPFYEGPNARSFTCSGIAPSSYQAPIAFYNRSGFAASIISGGVYRGVQDGCGSPFPPEYEGDYFYADYYQGFVRRIHNAGGTWSPAPAPGQPNANDWATGLVSVTDFAAGPEGALWYVRQFDSSFTPQTGSVRRVRPVTTSVRAPEVLVVGMAEMEPGSIFPLPFSVRNAGPCARAHRYALKDPAGWVVSSTAPLTGITPPLGPGASFDFVVEVRTEGPCDASPVDTLELSAYPESFPDSISVDTTRVRCSGLPALGVTSFSLSLETNGVKLQWTADPSLVSGFQVYRAEEMGSFQLLTSAPLPSAGGPSYAYLDSDVKPGTRYSYRVDALAGANAFPSPILSVRVPGSASLALDAPAPNPAEAESRIRIHVARRTSVEVMILDLKGRRVQALLERATLAPGSYVISWDGRGEDGRRVPSGLYFFEARTAEARASRRLAVIH